MGRAPAIMTPEPAPFDPRLTPARADLAAAFLKGSVDAQRFVDGERFMVVADLLDLRARPRADASLLTQMLHGETLLVYENEEGWGWGQSDVDGYVGYVAMSALRCGAVAMTHRVVVNRTFVYPAADMKQPILASIPLNGRVAVEDVLGAFAKIKAHGFVYAAHFAPIAENAPDFVAVAEQLEGTPYLWGGKSVLGIDCSGLVQVACAMAGISMPRDTDMQERRHEALPLNDRPGGLSRGDLVFWKGHVGIMLDDGHLLHANAHHMLVRREPLATAARRILANTGLPISSIRRINSAT